MRALSIVIPTLNEQSYLPLLLDSILAQQIEGDLQVVIVDGQSKDDTVSIAYTYKDKFHDFLVLSSEPNVGVQRNIGADNAHHELILFLDADIILAPNCLQKLSKKKYLHSSFIAATFHRSPNMTILDYFSLALIYTLFVIAWIARTPVVNGDFIYTTKQVHDSINGFKEGALLGEDTDYGVRAVKMGAKYKFIFDTYVVASDRRLRQMGRIKLIKIWSKAYLKARKEKPTYSGVEYPFGHYDD